MLTTAKWEIHVCQPQQCQTPPPWQCSLGWNCGRSRTPQRQAVQGWLGAGGQLCQGTLCHQLGSPLLGSGLGRGAFHRDGQFSSRCLLRQPQWRHSLQNSPSVSRGDQAVFCIRCSELSLSYKTLPCFGKRAVEVFFHCWMYWWYQRVYDSHWGGAWVCCGTTTRNRLTSIVPLPSHADDHDLPR